ncbi:MAG TPA: HAD family hydrolase [Flavisolibacter sp.]|nr:HAD family hydrolase [Flavisolibacter sp.]
MNKAVFLDKDGTLIPDIPYNVNPDLITLEEGVVEGLQLLKEQGYLLVIVSNQSGVAKGIFKEDALQPVQHKIEMLLAQYHVSINGFYYCPHFPNTGLELYARSCDCRKPEPGLLLKASMDLHIDLSQSWMVGDILNDVEAGKRAGCKAILIDNGNETEWLLNEQRTPDFKAATITEAAQYIVMSSIHKEWSNEKRLV